MTATRKFLERVRGLFPSAGETVPHEVDATPSPAPSVFARPASVVEARPDPRVAIAGPSPLMVEAYRDLHATAERLADRATCGLKISAGARRLYGLLVLAAVGNARSRGLSRLPDVAELHLPMELLALILDVNRTTVWRWASELGEDINRETGEIHGHQLAARWDHKTGAAPIAARGALEAQEKRAKGQGKGRHTAARSGVSDGLLWAVSLTGPRRGLRLSMDALKHEYRDLCADSVAASKNKGTAQGLRTVWALKNAGLQQSLECLKATEGAELAVRWTVNPGFKSSTPLNMTVAARSAALGAVWDVQSVRGLRRSEQAAAVDSAAQYLAALYGDSGSVSMYHWVLWRLVRLDTVGVNLWDVVLLTMDQVRGDLAAGDCTNAGALLMWRLKAVPEGGGQSLWAQLKDAYHLAPRTSVWS